MRKILLSAALAAICTMGMTAMASETAVTGTYIPGVNKYQSDGTTGAKTIIIYKDNKNGTITGDDIFYIDQAEDSTTGFVSNVEALMKSGATAGEYVVATNEGETTFVISEGAAAVEGCTPAKRLEGEYTAEEYGKEEYVSVGFQLEGITFAEWNAYTTVKTLLSGETEKVVATDFKEIVKWEEAPAIEGSTEIKCAIQVDWVPKNLADKFNLYLSTDTEQGE